MRTISALFAAGVFLTLGSFHPAAQQPARPDPLVREGTTKQIAEHVWIIPDNNVPMVPNVGIIVGGRSALVIDTGMGRRNGEVVLREAQKIAGTKPLYLATTHVHPEHDLGAHAFPASTRMIRAEAQELEIAEDGMTTAQRFTGMSAMNAELLKDATFRKADINFGDTYDLDLGGVQVKLIAMGFNHTRGDTAFMVSDGVLFSGDVVMTRLPNVNGPASRIKQWQTSLDRFEALKPRIIVPSHGPTGDLSMIAPYRQYFARAAASAN